MPSTSSLLQAGDPAPFETLYEDQIGQALTASKPLLLCDHAGAAFPKALNQLGLPAEALERHITYDIGAGGVTKHLANYRQLPAILGTYSRLVVDLNRAPDDPTCMRAIYDYTLIPRNRGLSIDEKAERQHMIFEPYHQKIATTLEAMVTADDKTDNAPIILSIHSFTPQIRTKSSFGKASHLTDRPWHIGILSNHDRRLADLALTFFNENHPELVIGDNLPYSGLDLYDYTLSTHVFNKGFPNLLIEIRQDLINTEAGQQRVASWLMPLIDLIMEQAPYG